MLALPALASSRCRLRVADADAHRLRGRSKLTSQIIPPHNFASATLYPEEQHRIRRPLVGPVRKVAKQIDPFFLRGEDPLDHVMNPLMSYQFVNQLGMIKGREQTGLTWKSQRRVGKMVRRARHMGLIPKWTNQPRPGGLADRDWFARR